MAEATYADLLTPALMKRLDRLDITSRKILSGKLQGERRSKKRGQSVEFADFRPYVTGDDLRRIDWNLYARLDKLFLRLFEEEEDLALNIVIDVSASMNYGDPNKLGYARQLAAALGYIGLVQHNRVSVFAIADGLVDQRLNLRGRRPVPELLAFLANLQPRAEGVTHAGDLTASFRTLAHAQRTPGVVVVISDWLDKGDLTAAIKLLARPRFDVYAAQVLSPQEQHPEKAQIVGDLKLVDLEDGDTADVSVTGPLIQRYRSLLEAYVRDVRETCLRRGVTHLLTPTDVAVDEVVLNYFRRRGLVG